MRKAAVTEWLLGLVVPPREAAAIAGDLLEDDIRRGGTWYWTIVTNTFARLLAGRIRRLQTAFLVPALLSWFGYMTVAVVLMAAAAAAAPAGAFLTTMLADHTGVGLVMDGLGTRAAWRGLEMVALWTVAPFVIGTQLARYARGAEVAVAALAACSWIAMAVFVPVVGFEVRTDGRPLVLMGMCLIGAAIRVRRRAMRV